MEYLLPDTFSELKNAKLRLRSNDKLDVTCSAEGGAIELDLTCYDQRIWLDYQFLVADVYHKSADVLVIIVKFMQRDGKFIRIHFGILPDVKTRLCLPLTALDGEKLFLERYPGVLQTVLRGDRSIDRDKISNFVIESIPSTVEREFELSNLHLRLDEPEFNYQSQAYIDELGQLKAKDWFGKSINAKSLKENLRKELEHYQNYPPQDREMSLYGGWKKLKFERTGFFRTEYDGSNWWLVDPDGYATFSLGIDCIRPNSPMKVSGMEHLISWLPSRTGEYADAWIDDQFDYGISNMIRAFGEDWYNKWSELNKFRLKDWKVNTIANWSEGEFIKSSQLPYVYPMEDFPSTDVKIYRDFPDVFSREYEENAKKFSKQLKPLRNDKMLVGYFMRNEPHWAFIDQLNLTETMLLEPELFVSKLEFINRLVAKYVTIEQLNLAWRTNYQSFDELKDPHKIELSSSKNRKDDFASFNRSLIARYVEIPSFYCKKVDPNHLNLGMRYAWLSNDDILAGCETFDVFSINSYQSRPDRKQIDRISEKLKMPVMIGEFHFGASDVGMLAYGIRATSNQHDRGLCYRYYVEQAATIPSLIGVHYFQFNDQPVLGRFDGENYQIGMIDVCQQPYQAFIEEIKLAHERIYGIRTGEFQPLKEPPAEIPKTGF